MTNENAVEREEKVENLGPMKLNAAAFKAALKKAKKNPVDCGIFDDWYAAHPEEKDKKK